MDERTVNVTFVSPAGLTVDDLGRQVRFSPGVDDGDPHSLMSEMRRGERRVPWESSEAQTDAIKRVLRCGQYTDDERADLLSWIGTTPTYGHADESPN